MVHAKLVVYGIGLVVLLLAACAPGPAAAPPKAPAEPPPAEETAPVELSPIRVVTVGAVSDAGLLIGAARGYFEEEGMAVEFDRTTAGAEALPLLATGEIQVAGTSYSAGFFNAVNRGVNVKIVADKGQLNDDWRGLEWVVRKDLWDSGELRELSDIRGKTIGINFPNTGGITDIVLRDLLAAAGVEEDEVNVIALPYPDHVPTLANNAVDLVLMLEPGLSIAVERDLGVPWENSPETGMNRQVALILYSPDFAESELGRRFAVAYLRGVRDFNDAMVKGIDTEAVIDIMTEESTVTNPAVYDQRNTLMYVDPDGEVLWDAMEDVVDLSLEKGLIEQPVDLAQTRDDSVLEYALNELGRY